MKSGWKRVLTACAGTVGTYVLISAVAKKVTEDKSMDNELCMIPDCQGDVRKGQQNENKGRTGVYEGKVKPVVDRLLSFFGLVFLSPVFVIISLAIVINDPGPVLFTQKRVGKDKQIFMLHKFRSMKMKTPHDVPTHQLENPEQYITRVGKFLRKYSLDELPQIWDIFRGRMSIIGPRPALWNQDDLIAERDKYGANDILPGLTGWAQINGRDELEIADKARLDGEYAEKLRQDGMKALFFDSKCFLGTVFSVLGSEGVVEGGTGELHKAEKRMDSVNAADSGFEDYGCLKHFDIDISEKNRKRVLITGAGSYIGESFERWAQEHYSANFTIDTVDMQDPNWRSRDFSSYDVVFHVAGIAHADVGKVTEEEKIKYYAVNTDLAIETAEKAKAEGVKQFVFMSSMIIYGDSAPYGKEKVIDEHTVPAPANFYGDSKWQADKGVRRLASEDFQVAVLRPPMIYGKGSKGNYPILAKLAKKLPVFPDVENKRSMLYIGNLCEFLCKLMLSGEGGVYFPQNGEYTKTSEMVRLIAGAAGKKIWVTKLLKPAVVTGSHVPGKVSGLVDKAFGNAVYSRKLSAYEGLEYQRAGLIKSVLKTEGADKAINCNFKNNSNTIKKKVHVLIVSQYFYPEQFRINDICQEWVKRGYKVTVVTGIPNYPMGKTFDGYGLTKKRHEIWNEIDIIRIPLIPRGSSTIGMVANYVSFMVSGIIAGKLKDIKADYVFSFEVSPMTQVLTGISFAKKLGVPHYLYVQDLWPENVVTVTGIKNPAIIKPIDKMVDYIYKNTNEIFTTSPSFVNAICNRKIKVPEEKVHYWPQYAEQFYRPVEKKYVPEIPDDDNFKVIFTGNIGTAQGLQILPKTAELLKDENVKFVMVGDGRYLEEFNREVHSRGVKDKFVMVPRQSAERIPELLAACDAAFISFQKAELWAMTIPAKLQSYMACGMPIIASAQGETKRVIEEAKCGICAPIGDAEALSEAIKSLVNANLAQLSKNSRDYFQKNYDKQKLMEQIEEYFR